MPIEYIPPRPDLSNYYVYAALCEDSHGQGYVKFGYSGRIDNRLSAVSSGSPIPVGYFAVIQVASKEKALMLEADLHKRFEARRSNGEWFSFDFNSPDDKKEFNEGCLHSFVDCGLGLQTWVKIDAQELVKFGKERQKKFLHSKQRKRIAAKASEAAQRRRAIKELAEYR